MLKREQPALSGETTIEFSERAAADYDERIIKLVPGYGVIRDLVAVQLLDGLPTDARVLVAGAGTGAELVRFAHLAPGWRFTAADPSADMLRIARDKVTAAGFETRVDFIEAAVEDLARMEAHHAAVALLVGHFVPDDGSRQRFLAAIARQLSPGALFLTVDAAQSALGAGGAAIYRRWAMLAGQSPAAADQMCHRVAVSQHPLRASRLAELFEAVGFEPPTLFFKALDYEGYLTRRRSA